LTLRLTNERGGEVVTVERELTNGFEILQTPSLADGQYTLTAMARVAAQELCSDPILFLVKQMPWEGNELGMTDAVFPPSSRSG
jgi:hypothetical protein